jgi:hypothetical protein
LAERHWLDKPVSDDCENKACELAIRVLRPLTSPEGGRGDAASAIRYSHEVQLLAYTKSDVLKHLLASLIGSHYIRGNCDGEQAVVGGPGSGLRTRDHRWQMVEAEVRNPQRHNDEKCLKMIFDYASNIDEAPIVL